MTAVVFVMAALCLLVALHPFVTYPLSLLLMRRAPAPRLAAPDDARPSVVLCASAYNEALVIVDKVERMLEMAARYGPATVHIYVDGATDDTAALLQPYTDRIDLVVSRERLGKTAGLNLLVARSHSDLIAFTDANVQTPANGLIDLAAPFADPTIGCTSAKLVYSNAHESSTSAAGSLYWRIEEGLKRVESETVGVIGVDGAFFMLRRALYEPAPPSLIDDLYVTLAVLLRGYRVITVDRVEVRERSAVAWREEFHRKRRIACQAMNVHRALWSRLRRMPATMRYAYISHRFLKWVSPFVLALAALFFLLWFALLAGPLNALLLCGGGAVLLGVLGMMRLQPVSVAASAIASLAGVAVGVIESWSGRKSYQVWMPAPSVRDPGAEGLDG